MRGQVLKESLGFPSLARSPKRFMASLGKDGTAKTVGPMGVPEKELDGLVIWYSPVLC